MVPLTNHWGSLAERVAWGVALEVSVLAPELLMTLPPSVAG